MSEARQKTIPLPGFMYYSLNLRRVMLGLFHLTANPSQRQGVVVPIKNTPSNTAVTRGVF